MILHRPWSLTIQGPHPETCCQAGVGLRLKEILISSVKCDKFILVNKENIIIEKISTKIILY